MNIIKLEVDGYPVAVLTGSTIRQAADSLGIELPRFCYHERLRVAGNCRICLVEVMGAPKPVASCAIPVSMGIKVFTSSPIVKKAREAVIELLRANHPRDCPICDQGGECDLQDQAIRYGSDRTRMYEAKRGVEDKYLGPLVKIVITRCIHCTRCIRFASEVAGVGLLGTSGRGSDTEVGTYLERAMESELSGNRIDRCPVGALTSKQLAFKVRPWELDGVDTYDESDAILSSTRIQVIGNKVYRVIPRNNDEVNGQWLGDKGRFIIDAYNQIRAKRVMVRNDIGHRVIDDITVGVDYVGDVLDVITRTRFIVSQSIDLATMSIIKKVSDKLPEACLLSMGYSSKLIRSGYKSEYVSVSRLSSLNNEDIVRLIGTDMRKEVPVGNVILRNSYVNGGVVLSVGNQLRNTFPIESITYNNLLDIYNGTYIGYDNIMKVGTTATVRGTSVFQRDTSYTAMAIVRDIAINITIEGAVNVDSHVVHTRSNTVGAIMLGRPGYDSMVNYRNYDSVINIGVLISESIEQGLDIVYSSGVAKLYTAIFTPWLDAITSIYDVIIPLVANTEQESTLVSTEGRYVMTKKVITGTLIADKGSVNAFMLSTLLYNGVQYDDTSGSYYSKRIIMLSYRYESIDNDTDIIIVPSLHDYYTEGHTVAAISSKISECSELYMKRNSFSIM